MENFKLFALILVVVTIAFALTPIADLILNNPGVIAGALLLAAGILAFTSFTAGLFITHLKFGRVSSKN